MAQFMPSVLPARHRRVQARLGDRQPHLRSPSLWRRKKLCDLDRKIFLTGLISAGFGQGYGNLGLLRCRGNRLESLLDASSGKLHAPIHHHLRRIGVAIAKHVRIGQLPGGPIM